MADKSSFEKLQTCILVLLAACIPLRWIIWSSILELTWVALVIVEVIYLRRPLFPYPKHLLFLSAFVLATAISILYSSNLPPVFSKLETRLSILALPLLFLASFKINEKVLHLILFSFAVSCTVISIVCLADTFYANYSNGVTFNNGNSWYFSSDNLVEKYGFHPSYFSIYCSTTVFIAWYFFRKKIIGLLPLVIIIVYYTAFILLLASRVGILAFAVVASLTMLYETWVAKKLWIGALMVVGFSGLMFLLIMNSYIAREKFYAMLGINVHQYNEPFRVNKRYEEWGAAFEVFKAHPIGGVGVGDMQDELQKTYAARGFSEGVENEYNPHNLVMDTAAGLGLFGLLTLVVLFGVSLASAWRSKNVLHLQVLILFLLISIVEASLSVQKGIIFFTFFNSLFYAKAKLD